MRQTPGYRSSKRTLEKLAQSYILFESEPAEVGVWDDFRVRNLGLAAERAGGSAESGLARVVSLIPDWTNWSADERLGVERILQAKESGSEARYLRLMQGHRRLRAAVLRMGSARR
jgi:hypothetical protein